MKIDVKLERAIRLDNRDRYDLIIGSLKINFIRYAEGSWQSDPGEKCNNKQAEFLDVLYNALLGEEVGK